MDEKFRRGYKATKIGWIPEDWSLVSFEDIVTKSQYGLSVASTERGTIPIFKMNNFNNGRMSKSNLDRVEIDTAELNAFRLSKGDILFNRTNSYDLVGKTAMFDLKGDFVFASYLVRFCINQKKAEPEYVNFFFNWEATQKRIKAIATKGVSQVNINPTSLKHWLKIPLPPLPEQRKIAQILSTWDKAIELTEKLIAAKERRKRGLMQQLLTGKKRFQEFEKRNDWCIERLGKFVRLQGGYAFKSSEFQKAGVPVIRISNIDGVGVNLLNDIVFYDEIEISDNYKIFKGDMLIAMSGATTGKLGRFQADHTAYLNQRVGKFVVKDNRLLNYEYLCQILNFSDFQEGLKKDLATGAQPNISASQIENVRVRLTTDIKEQQKIAALLSTCDKEIQVLKHRLSAPQQQKKGLMQKLLTGKIRVNISKTEK